MSAPEQTIEQLIDLLIEDATDGLSVDDQRVLDELVQAFPQVQSDAIEQTVAALSVALLANSERPPQALSDRIVAAGTQAVLPVVEAPASNIVDLGDARRASATPQQSSSYSGTAGWWVAAASLLLALAGWWPRLVGNEATFANSSPTQARKALLASGHAIHASWTPPATDGSQALVGDVVFDPVTQRGFLSFRGIPANDPRLAQYQLWIVDARRKQPEPVDGGVFNVAGQATTGEIVIPFEARLPVGQPAAFVVTLEQPGGVVISKQERVLALAKVGAT